MVRQISLLTCFLCLSAGSVFSQSRTPRQIARLCNRVAQIRGLPLKADFGGDAAYQAIVGAGETVVTCLIQKVTDTTPMHDPRCPPIARTTVGDVAYFVLTDITKLDFVELLPADVQKNYETYGAYAYHAYIRRKGARRQLQSRLLAWYRQKHPSSSSPADRR